MITFANDLPSGIKIVTVRGEYGDYSISPMDWFVFKGNRLETMISVPGEELGKLITELTKAARVLGVMI